MNTEIKFDEVKRLILDRQIDMEKEDTATFFIEDGT